MIHQSQSELENRNTVVPKKNGLMIGIENGIEGACAHRNQKEHVTTE